MVYPITNRTILLFFRLLTKEVKGINNIPKPPFIIAANHESWWDPFFIISVIVNIINKKVHFLAMTRTFFVLGDTIFRKWAGCIPIFKEDHRESALKEAFELLQKNEIIGIFPKLFPDKHDKKPEAKTGAVRLALAAKVPIVPIALVGTKEIAPGFFSIKTFFPRKLKRIKIIIKEPIYLKKYYNKKIKKETLKKLVNQIMEKIEG